MSKKVVAVLFGGTSVEHEISLISASSVMKNLDRDKFDLLPVLISKEGQWKTVKSDVFQESGVPQAEDDSFLVPYLSMKDSGVFLEVRNSAVLRKIKVDVVFPVLHGTFGEDGTVQGLLELMNTPYVGASVLGSSVGMDKIIMKDVLSRHALPVVDYTGFNGFEWKADRNRIQNRIIEEIGFPCFVKSADLGSSVGVRKVYSSSEIEESVDYSLKFSSRVIVEKAVENTREIEVSVLGNEAPIASVPGEIVPKHEFYDYEAKYHDDSTELKIPAEIGDKAVERLKEISVKAFSALCCSGMGRIDFLMDAKTENIYISEINTIPGFTSISMYPKLWESSGLPYGELLTRLIELALESYSSKKSLKTDYIEK